MQHSAIVTGAGTGVGRATALALANAGWTVALLGRTESTLEETRKLAPRPDEMIVLPCDVADASAVDLATQSALSHFGGIQALVCSAGTNTAKRSWSDTTDDDFELVMKANLDGVYHSIRAVLPTMRQQKSGTIVAIASIASLKGMAQPGVAECRGAPPWHPRLRHFPRRDQHPPARPPRRPPAGGTSRQNHPAGGCRRVRDACDQFAVAGGS
jgi:NAD(P)-dependent dehydrogenase (short-subunit alcohol dehydrogenase family)